MHLRLSLFFIMMCSVALITPHYALSQLSLHPLLLPRPDAVSFLFTRINMMNH